VSQLLHYPYGCAEQTSSSLLPWVLLQQTPELSAFTRRSTNETAAAARAGIQRLLSMQTSSGGLAYWPGGKEPMLWASAYGGFVLALARQAGLSVPDKEFGALMEFLSAQLRTQTGDAAESWERCLALYTLALAERAEPAYHEKFFQQRRLLPPESRALLALAVAKSQGDSGMIRELLQTNAPPKPFQPDPFTCSAREKAIRLLALTSCRPNDPEGTNFFVQLQQGQRQAHWDTTQGNAWALLALSEYLQKTETASDAGAGALVWGAQTNSFRLPVAHGLFAQTVPLDPATADQSLRLVCSSAKPLFAQVAVESRSQATNQLRLEHGLSLQRRYYRLNDNNEPEPFDSLRVGDRVLVTLRLAAPQPARYVAVDDPLPGVLEAIHPEFKTQQIAGSRPPAWMTRDDGDYWQSDFREIRADRVLFFSDYVGPGSYVIRYVARVRAAGAVIAPPAKAEEMYHPDRFGLTETQLITSLPSE
jgi:uncharacterized protein YfaS (alpha-2-macroglobulin family)